MARADPAYAWNAAPLAAGRVPCSATPRAACWAGGESSAGAGDLPGARLASTPNDGGWQWQHPAASGGAVHVQGRINGYKDERCGNADLTSVIPNLQLKRWGGRWSRRSS